MAGDGSSRGPLIILTALLIGAIGVSVWLSHVGGEIDAPHVQPPELTRSTPKNPPTSVKPPPDVAPGRTVTPRGDLASSERSTIELFERSSPAVVHITTLQLARDRVRFNVMEIPRGTGSGFVWDAQGHVVTNFHVVQGAQAARVTLSDNTSVRAKLVGVAPDKDLAVLKIDVPKDKLRPLTIGTSKGLRVGQSVFAIGNPFGLDQTLTTGVISGLNREITSVTQRPIIGVIQTDAAINPGNSGGPLLDSAGRLIGVNTAIYSPSGAYAGIGFAVPVDTVNRIVPQLITSGKVVRPGLGIQIADARQTEQMGLKGVLVLGVVPDSAAAKAGMRGSSVLRDGRVLLGDVIVGLEGKRIEDPDDLYKALDTHRVGDVVTVTVARRGGSEKLQIPLQALQ